MLCHLAEIIKLNCYQVLAVHKNNGHYTAKMGSFTSSNIFIGFMKVGGIQPDKKNAKIIFKILK